MTGPEPVPPQAITAELLARMFHETYERLAPGYRYKTREASAVPWDDVPEPNRSLMIAVAGEVLEAAAPHLAAAERERCAQLAEKAGAHVWVNRQVGGETIMVEEPFDLLREQP